MLGGVDFTTFLVFRHPVVASVSLEEIALKLVNVPRYEAPGKRENAPQSGDCLTIIHYLFQKALGVSFSLCRIGNMPRELFKYSEWRLLRVQLEDLKIGDLIFVAKKGHVRAVSHLAVYLGLNRFFHCSRDKGTVVIDQYRTFNANYEQKFRLIEVISYKDPRPEEERVD